MTRASSAPPGLPANITPPPGLPPDLGVSLSGEQYFPDITAGLGLKATVVVSVPKEEAFNANLSMEISFNAKASGGGIRAFYFDGIAYFMSNLKIDVAPAFNINDPAAVKAEAHIDVQFTPQFKLHGSFATYLKVGDVLEGAGTNGKITNAEFHIEPGKWYINIGTPSDPQGIRLKLGGATLAEIKMYMDIGKNIPPMPPLPAKVKALTGMGNFMANETLRASGNGFAFGSSIQIGDGQRKCLPGCDAFLYFYAKVLASAGFDLMLQDYGEAVCSNNDNEPLGINGWYASGQAYMLLESALGVGFKIFGQRKEVDILDVGVAAALQMKLPNPFWAKGAVGGKFRVMGGLVKGDIKFSFTVGESCQYSGGTNPDDNLLVINSLEPINEAERVDVAIHPNVTFNLPVGKEFLQSGASGSVTFQTQLAYAKLTYNGYDLPVDYVWQDDNTYLKLIPRVMLPPFDTVFLEVKVNIYKNNQLQAPDVKTAVFTTGPSYAEIPDFNVKASYPLDGQYNFYPSEWMSQKGYILLYANQPDLLALNAQQGKVSARITSAAGNAVNFPVTYSSAEAKLEFPLPAGNFSPQTLYKLEIIAKDGPANGGESTSRPGAAFRSGIPGSPESQENVLYDAYFRTSQYPRFFDKIAAFGDQQGLSVPAEYGSFKIPILTEPFDEFEIGQTGPVDLVQMSAKLEQTNWYASHVKPLIYEKYAGNQPGNYGIWIDERPAEPHGRIPYKAVLLESAQGGVSLRVNAAHFESGNPPAPGEPQQVYYLAPKVIGQDWDDICRDVWDYITNSWAGTCCLNYNCCYYINPNNGCSVTCDGYTNAEAYRNYYIGYMLPNETLRNMYRKIGLNLPASGAYPIEVSYRLPGLGHTTSIRSVNLQKN